MHNRRVCSRHIGQGSCLFDDRGFDYKAEHDLSVFDLSNQEMSIFLCSGHRICQLRGLLLSLGLSFFLLLGSLFFLELLGLEAQKLIRVLEFRAQVKSIASPVGSELEGCAARTDAELHWALSESD